MINRAVRITKVKAHQIAYEGQSIREKWLTQGNDLADQQAKTAVQQNPLFKKLQVAHKSHKTYSDLQHRYLDFIVDIAERTFKLTKSQKVKQEQEWCRMALPPTFQERFQRQLASIIVFPLLSNLK